MFEQLNFYIKHSINDLRINGRRTLFALLCIAAGVGAIVSLQTLGVMIDKTLTGSLRETNKGDIRIFPNPDFGQDNVNTSRRASDGLTEGDDEFGFIFTPEGVATITEWFEENVDSELRITYQNAGPRNSVAGISIGIPDKDTDQFPVVSYIIEADQYPLYGEARSVDGDQSLSDMLKNPTDVVFSENLADDLDATVGDTVRINGADEDFTLVGIVPADTEGGFNNLIASIFGYYYLDVRSVALFEDMEPDYAQTIFVAIKDEAEVDAVNERFANRYSYLNSISTTDLRELNSTISNAVNDMITVMGLVSMLIGGIGIVNTMLVIVSRRTTEVAILKTIGLEPNQVTYLFLVEAVIMGILGSILGIFLGWFMAFMLQTVAERFVAQNLVFTPALVPAANGFIVGILVTTIFGFMPTLTAGQVRPASVLRPSDSVIPTSGRLASFAALMIVLFALSVVAQGLIGDLLSFDSSVGSNFDNAAENQLNDDPNAQVTTSEDLPSVLADIKLFNLITGGNGAIIGLLMVVPIILGGFLDMWRDRRGRNWILRFLLWIALFLAVPIGGFVFGYFIPTIILITITFIIAGSLYLLLMLLIWAVGGGRIQEFPVLGNLPWLLRILSFLFFPAWAAFLVFVIVVIEPSATITAAFLGLLFFIHIPAIIVTLVLPAWVLGQLLQRFGFLDLKISLRAMVSTKGRGASTLLALVIGILTLSLITMMVSTVTTFFEELLEEATGGNLLIFPAGGAEAIPDIEAVLNEQSGVNSYAVLRNYNIQLINVVDVSEGEVLSRTNMRQRIEADFPDGGFIDSSDIYADLLSNFNSLDARELNANLPDVKFADGRQLTLEQDEIPSEEDIWSIVISDSQAVQSAGIEAGDLITLGFDEISSDTQTFRIVGIIDTSGGTVEGFSAPNYVPLAAVGDRETNELVIIADVKEEHVRTVRRAVMEIPGVFALETRLFNEVLNTVINQFTSLPILVAALALFTGGIVIANSVALSTMERRREIGIMKAVGLQRERVLGMLLLENGLMGLIGGLIGVGIAVLLLMLLLVGPFEGELGDAIPIVPAMLLMSLCIAIALVAAIFSVWGASGEKPMNVLRYE